MTPFQQTKLFLMHTTGLEKDALHIYVSLIVFLGTCLLFKWKPSSWKPWLAVLAAAVAGEMWDLHDTWTYNGRLWLMESWKDLWNTLMVPTILMLTARYTRIFRKG